MLEISPLSNGSTTSYYTYNTRSPYHTYSKVRAGEDLHGKDTQHSTEESVGTVDVFKEGRINTYNIVTKPVRRERFGLGHLDSGRGLGCIGLLNTKLNTKHVETVLAGFGWLESTGNHI